MSHLTAHIIGGAMLLTLINLFIAANTSETTEQFKERFITWTIVEIVIFISIYLLTP